MVAPSFAELFVLFFLPLLNRSAAAPDILSLVDPAVALEIVGEKQDEARLEQLIRGASAAKPADAPAYDVKEAESAIQNLASSSEGIRDKARAKLVSLGKGVQPRIEEVIAKDSRRAEEAKKVLDELLAARAGESHRETVLRTLALRLAAQKKLKRLSAVAHEAAKSDHVFVAAAAKETAAILDETPGAAAANPAPTGAPAPAPLSSALEALPRGTRLLLAARNGGPGARGSGEALRIDRITSSIYAASGLDAGAIASKSREVMAALVQFVLAYGNMRLENLYVANVGSVGPSGGGLALIGVGDYERAAFETGLQSSAAWVVGEANGMKVFTSPFARIVPLDARTVLVLPQEASKHFPLAEFLDDWKAQKKALRSEPRWDKFLGTLQEGSSVRGLAITDDTLMAEIYKAMEGDPDTPADIRSGVKGLREVELDVAPLEDSRVRYRLEGAFASAEDATHIVDFMKDQIRNGIQEMEQSLSRVDIPMIRKMLEIMKSIHISADGKKTIFRLEIDPMALISSIGMGAAIR
ncbi:MAG TPA: hypothetical protein VFD71_18250 [Planctomycetota bacterium]|nr:hypothetical protein [Planctomycetota bacterium]